MASGKRKAEAPSEAGPYPAGDGCDVRGDAQLTTALRRFPHAQAADLDILLPDHEPSAEELLQYKAQVDPWQERVRRYAGLLPYCGRCLCVCPCVCRHGCSHPRLSRLG